METGGRAIGSLIIMEETKKEALLPQLFKETQFTIHLFLTPQEIHTHYRSLLLDKCKQEWEDQCHLNKGYILQVVSLHAILHEEIMEMCPNILFKASFNIISYLPQIGNVIPMTVDIIFDDGIFGHFYKINIIVPTQYCQDHKWSIHQNFLGNIAVSQENNDRIIRPNDVWMVSLKHLRYERESFSCIAEPYDDDTTVVTKTMKR